MKYTKLQIADAIHTYVDMRKTYIVWKRQVERDKELRNAPEFLEFKAQLKEKELGLQQMAVDLGMDLWDSTQGCAALGFLDGFLAGLGSLPTYRKAPRAYPIVQDEDEIEFDHPEGQIECIAAVAGAPDVEGNLYDREVLKSWAAQYEGYYWDDEKGWLIYRGPLPKREANVQ